MGQRRKNSPRETRRKDLEEESQVATIRRRPKKPDARKEPSAARKEPSAARKQPLDARKRPPAAPAEKRSPLPLVLGALGLVVAAAAVFFAVRTASPETPSEPAVTATETPKPAVKAAPTPATPAAPATETPRVTGPRFLEAGDANPPPPAPEKVEPPKPAAAEKVEAPKPAAPESPASRAPAGVPSNAKEAKVVRCVDGDTIIVRLDGKDEKIRMKGVDTPETVHPTKAVQRYGKEASNFTKARLDKKTVWIELDPAGRDKYGRLLAFIWCEDGTCHNETLIREGYGHAYTHYPFDRMEKYRALEKAAREAKRGLWGPGG